MPNLTKVKSVNLADEDGNLISSSNPLSTSASSPQLALELDEAAASITYVGEATAGSGTSVAVWRIKRLDESTDPELIITWADGNTNFDNIWDDRAGLSYS